MAVEAKIFSCIVCIWLTSTVYCQTITGRPHDYGELSKAVDRFLNILIEEEDFDNDDSKLESWETLLKEDINPKLKILAHVMRSLSSTTQDTSSLREQVLPNGYISRYLQAFLTDYEQPFWEDSSSKQLPSLQSPELDQIMTGERNNFWSDTFHEIPDELSATGGESEKRNGIWYGKRAPSDNTAEEQMKRNGFWYGKRSSPADKRNGIWYGKRNGIWYGKRNGLWYGKRDDGSLYTDEVM